MMFFLLEVLYKVQSSEIYMFYYRLDVYYGNIDLFSLVVIVDVVENVVEGSLWNGFLMMKWQMSFVEVESVGKKCVIWCQCFLDEMEKFVLWLWLLMVIELYYLKGECGCLLIGLEWMF